MKRFVKNSIVLFIVLIVAAGSLSVPTDQPPVELPVMLPGRGMNWPDPVLLAIGVLLVAMTLYGILKLFLKINAKPVSVMLIAAGAASMLASGILLIYNRTEESGAADFSQHTAQALIEQIKMETIQTESPPPPSQNASEPGADETPGEPVAAQTEQPGYLTIDGNTYIGVISIPALELELPVNRILSYTALRRTPCRYSGSIEDNTLVIAAHNYRAHFGHIDRLAIGELIIIIDAEGIEHTYGVEYIEVVPPSSVDEVIYSEYDLTLFTCTQSGQERIVVRALRIT